MTIPSEQELLAKIEEFLERTGMSPTRFGLEAMSEGGLVKSIREGRSVTLRKGRQILAFMTDYERQVELGGVDHDDTDTTGDGAPSAGKVQAITAASPLSPAAAPDTGPQEDRFPFPGRAVA